MRHALLHGKHPFDGITELIMELLKDEAIPIEGLEETIKLRRRIAHDTERVGERILDLLCLLLLGTGVEARQKTHEGEVKAKSCHHKGAYLGVQLRVSRPEALAEELRGLCSSFPRRDPHTLCSKSTLSYP